MIHLINILAVVLSVSAHQGHGHPKHNMVMFGETEVFASHIVYKQPHNYQVILKLKLSRQVFDRYLSERSSYPKDQLIYLLNEMDISNIRSATAISGALLRVDEQGNRNVILPLMELSKGAFEVLYFNEVPLSLE